MTDEANVAWVGTGGGPLIAVPESVLEAWTGAVDEDEDLDDDDVEEEAGDYGRACAVTGYAGVIDVGGASVLVLGDDPAPTTFVAEHSLFLRRLAADSEGAAVGALARAMEVARWEEATPWEVSGPVVVFDSAYSAVDLGSTSSLRVDLAPGRYRVDSASVEPDDDTWLLLVRLSPVASV
ncbi:Imm21 family immunity protein [Agromyces cerinus]|uniref:Immunity protein 21 n=1 Tax=Agromyces cerinus subsp. cerinus TaxID=232089 RepID=A0A1N6E8D2_9MICO|nr:Imm21 family immunity protein [Agromyces cerinus]SIN79221.1 Immunity protein 21 [Agromyces cerinus subsp. cerinus]